MQGFSSNFSKFQLVQRILQDRTLFSMVVAAHFFLLAATAVSSVAGSRAADVSEPTFDLLETLSKEQLVHKIRALEQRPPLPQEQLWPELQKTPSMMWNGWLPTTRGLIPGFQNNESLYYAAADRLVTSGLRDAGYDTIAATCMGWQRNPKTKKLYANPVTWPVKTQDT